MVVSRQWRRNAPRVSSPAAGTATRSNNSSSGSGPSRLRAWVIPPDSRRIGVSLAAPYRHFASRDDLLASVATRALDLSGQALAAQAPEAGPPEQRLAAMASGYVRFAAEQRPLFSVVFGVGLDKKSRHPQRRQAYENVEGMPAAAVTELCPADPAAADQLADAIEATAHGYAALLTDQPGSPDPAAIDRAAAQAARATLALIRGRAALQADSR